MNDLKIFALNSSKDFGQKVASSIGIDLSEHEEKLFSDDEVYCASLENVRGKDVFVIQSLFSDEEESVSSKLLKLLIFIGSLKGASASRITVVLPYMCYGRQDRKIRPRNPISTKYIAKIIESVGADRLLTMDCHNPTAIQNCYSICTDLLEANVLFLEYVRKFLNSINDLTIMSPDVGGLSRARKFRNMIEYCFNYKVGLACIDKIHDDKLIQANDIMGDVENRTVVLIDDMISSGSTLSQCVEIAVKKGAKKVVAVATHGLFVGNCNDNLLHNKLEKIVITDTISPLSFRIKDKRVKDKIEVVDTTKLFGQAILHIHRNESISKLLEAE